MFCRHVIICSSDGLGCSGQIAIKLTWQQPQQVHPHIAVLLDLNPLQLQLHPHHLPLLSKVADCLNESSQQAQQAQHGRPDTAGNSTAQQREAGFVAGARNYVESALLPNCERLAQDVVGALSWNSSANHVPASSAPAPRLPADDGCFWDSNSSLQSTAFHDVHSMMDSAGTTFNSFLSTTAASLGSSFTPSSSAPVQHRQPQSSQPLPQGGVRPNASPATKLQVSFWSCSLKESHWLHALARRKKKITCSAAVKAWQMQWVCSNPEVFHLTILNLWNQPTLGILQRLFVSCLGFLPLSPASFSPLLFPPPFPTFVSCLVSLSFTSDLHWSLTNYTGWKMHTECKLYLCKQGFRVWDYFHAPTYMPMLS